MNDNNHQLISYLATLAAIVFIVIAVLVALWAGVTVTESIGIAIVLGGLIGALQRPSQRSVTVDNDKSDPVPTEPQDAP